MFKGKKAVIFDLDGTLIDSVGIWNTVDELLIKKIGGGTIDNINIQKQRDDALSRFSKAPDPYLEYCGFLKDKYESGFTPEEIRQFRYDIAKAYLEETVDLKPGADTLLRYLKSRGYILALATTTSRSNITVYTTRNKNLLSKIRFDDFFSIILTKDDVKETKPNPEVHFKILEQLALRPGDCIIVEDSAIGVEAAKQAGIDAAAIYDKYSDYDREEITEKSLRLFNDYQEMLGYIKNELEPERN